MRGIYDPYNVIMIHGSHPKLEYCAQISCNFSAI